VPKQLTDKNKGACMEMCMQFFSDIVKKERLSCGTLSQVMKYECTAMNLLANMKAWSGNTHQNPGPRNSKVCLPRAK
jgi:hypothetical protein